MRIQLKISLIMIIPILVIIYFSIISINDKSKTLNELNNLEDLSELSIKISSVVHEAQKERGRTSGFMGSGGTQFINELSEQRKLTDRKREELRDFLKGFDSSNYREDFKLQLDSSLKNLENIKNHRSKVDNLSISDKEAIDYYTSTIKSLISTVSYISKTSSNSEMTTMLDAYVNFLKAKEYTGIERAVASNTFAGDKFGEGFYIYYISLISAQDSYLDSFKAGATKDQIDYYREKMSEPAVLEVKRMREVLLEKGSVGGFGIEATYWFDTMTKKINSLKDVEDKLSSDIHIKADQLKKQAKQSFISTVLIFVISLLLTIVLTYSLVKVSITTPINQLTKIVEDISTGKIDAQIDSKLKDSNDEIGQLAKAFDRTVVSLKIMMANSKIGKNDEKKAESLNKSN